MDLLLAFISFHLAQNKEKQQFVCLIFHFLNNSTSEGLVLLQCNNKFLLSQDNNFMSLSLSNTSQYLNGDNNIVIANISLLNLFIVPVR